MSGLINDFDKVIILRVVKVCLISDCSGLSKCILMSPTRQQALEVVYVIKVTELPSKA